MRLIALDVGTKRIGVAILIPPDKSPKPLTCLERAQGRAEKELLEIISKNKIEGVIVGLPLSESGASTEMSESVNKFCDRLRKRTEAKIMFIDEWGSSIEAEQRLKNKKIDLKSRKTGLIDSEAASIILQMYLDLCEETKKL